jgi:hypothetical protein
MSDAWVSQAFVWATGGDAAGVGGPTCPDPTNSSQHVPQVVAGHACHYDVYPHNPACGHHAYCNIAREECGCCADDLDAGQCALLGWAGYSVQGVLVLFGLYTALHINRCFEKPQRPWSIFILDANKLAFSGTCAHLFGMFNSWLLDDPDEGGNGCSWYFISFTFDTTLGVVIGYFLLQLLQKVATSGAVGGVICPSLQSSGNYKKEGTDEVDYLIWAKQMGSWCTITVIARACVGCLLLLNKFWLQSVSQWVAGLFKCHPDGFLVLVMLGCPFGMNALQLVRAHPPSSPGASRSLLTQVSPAAAASKLQLTPSHTSPSLSNTAHG